MQNKLLLVLSALAAVLIAACGASVSTSLSNQASTAAGPFDGVYTLVTTDEDQLGLMAFSDAMEVTLVFQRKRT